MPRASFDKTAMLYNFVEKHIWEDYSSACFIINEYLTLAPEEKIIDVGGGTGRKSHAVDKEGRGGKVTRSRGQLGRHGRCQ